MSLESYKTWQFAAELGRQAADCCFWLVRPFRGVPGYIGAWPARLKHGYSDDYGIHVALGLLKLKLDVLRLVVAAVIPVSVLRRHAQVDAVHSRDAKLWKAPARPI